jgi:hypothetical protein
MERWRWLLVAVVTYFAFDVLNPFVPGIFFFDADQLFVDGVVEATPRSALRDPDSARLDTPVVPVVIDRPPVAGAESTASGERASTPRPSPWRAVSRLTSDPSPVSDDH